MKEISNRLEDEGKVEVCKVCGSIHILETAAGVTCGKCGVENFTEEIDENTYTEKGDG